jgi:hypothetical protein
MTEPPFGPAEQRAPAIVWSVAVASILMLGWMGRSAITGLVPFTGDLLHFHYPLRDFYAAALAKGQPFDWMPSFFTGFYIVGEGQLGGYHPLHLLLYRLLPLDRAFAIELIAAYPFVFAGMRLFLRRWCDGASAAVGAMLFTFSGFALSHGVHPNMVGVVAHLPWILWAIDRAFAAVDWRRRIGALAWIGLLTGSQLLLGHPQALWLSALAEAAYAVMLLTRPSPHRWSSAASVAGGWLLGGVVGAVQLLPTLHAVRGSLRIGYDTAYAETFSMPPLHLLQLIEPYMFWGRILRWNEAPGANDEVAVYGGAVALILSAWWLGSYVSRRRRGHGSPLDRFGVSVAAFGAVGLWLASGSYGRLYRLQTLLPVVGRFRVPERFVLFTQLSLAILAALAVQQLLRDAARSGERKPSTAWMPWAVAAGSVIGAVWYSRTAMPASTVAVVALTAGPALFVTAATLLTFAIRGNRWAIVALVLLAGADQALYGLGGVIGWHDYLSRAEVLKLVDKRDVIAPGRGRLAYAGFPNIFVLAGYRLLDGYVGLAPERQLDYHSLPALRVADVGYANGRFVRETPALTLTALKDDWYAVPRPLPRARLVAQARISDRPNADITTIDVDTTALVTRPLPLDGGTAGEATIVADTPGSISVDTQSPGTQLLVVSESFDEGWRGSIDANDTTVERVNGDFMGAVVPAGRHRVTLTFRPFHLIAGRYLSGAGALIAIAMLVVAGRRRSDD